MSLSACLWVRFVILTQGWQPLNYIQPLKSIISIEDGRHGRHPLVMCACVYVCKYFAHVCASVLSWRTVVKEEDCEGACGEEFAPSDGVHEE